MDLRRFLNIAFAHLTREIKTTEAVETFRADVLNAKFDYEMTPQEQRRAAVRRKELELGISGQAQAAMDSFRLPSAGSA